MVKEVDSRRAPRERARGKSKGQEQGAGWQLVVFGCGWANAGGFVRGPRTGCWAGDWV